MPPEFTLKNDEKFTSESNADILWQLIPRIIASMKPRFSPSYKQINDWLGALHKHRIWNIFNTELKVQGLILQWLNLSQSTYVYILSSIYLNILFFYLLYRLYYLILKVVIAIVILFLNRKVYKIPLILMIRENLQQCSYPLNYFHYR